MRFDELSQGVHQRVHLMYKENHHTCVIFLHPQLFDLYHRICEELDTVLFDIRFSEEVRDGMVRSYVCEGFTVGVLPSAHIILDFLCRLGFDVYIEPSNVLEDCAKELKPLHCSVAIVKVLVNVRVRDRRCDRFAYFRKVFLKLRYHSSLVFDGIRSENHSHARNSFTASIFAIASREDGLSIGKVSHGDDEDVRKAEARILSFQRSCCRWEESVLTAWKELNHDARPLTKLDSGFLTCYDGVAGGSSNHSNGGAGPRGRDCPCWRTG